MSRARTVANFGDGIATADIDDGAVTAAKIGSLPAGSVLQVVSANRTTAISSSTSTSETIALSVNITPTSASNKIFVICNGGDLDTQASNQQVVAGLFRGATNLGPSANLMTGAFTTTGGRILVPLAMSYLDSPSTTSEVTYNLKFHPTASVTVQLNSQSQTVTLTAMEIAG